MTATKTIDLLAIAERCEKATGPDRELDAEIGKAANAQPVMICDTGNVLIYQSFTASLDAAMTLVPEGYYWEASFGVMQGGKGPYWAECYRMDGSDYDYEPPIFGAAIPALALCAAALRAMEASNGQS